MTPEIMRRLARLERRSPKAMSDDELLAALNNRKVDVRHLEALYTRIEVPFTAMIHLAAVRIRKDQAAVGRMEGWPWFPFFAVAWLIAVDTDTELPEEILTSAHNSMEFEGIPRTNRSGMIWIADVGSWLVTRLVQRRGGLQSMRDEVARLHQDGTYDFLPVLTTDESSRLLRFTNPLEYVAMPTDLPVMVWRDAEDGWYSSYRTKRPPRFLLEARIAGHTRTKVDTRDQVDEGGP